MPRKKNLHPAAAYTSRAPSDRMLRIHQRLKEARVVTSISLAEECEVDRRTIKRDIRHMREYFGAPIQWDPVADTYSYTEPYDDLKHARIDTGEAVAFALASRLMAAWRGTPLGRALISIYAKIAPLVAGAFTFPISVLDEVIYIPEETDAAEFQHIGTLVNACQRRQTLRISYRKPGDGEPTLRTVEPLGVAFFDYRWILVAVDPVRKKPCNFRLTRLHGVAFTGKSFTPPAGFNLAKHLEGNFGPYTGDEDHTVVVALTGFAASNAFERRWHKSQVLTQRPGGGVEITLRLNNLVDVQREILSWGAEAEPLAPPQLRTNYRAAVAAMAARVADQPPAT